MPKTLRRDETDKADEEDVCDCGCGASGDELRNIKYWEKERANEAAKQKRGSKK